MYWRVKWYGREPQRASTFRDNKSDNVDWEE